MKNLFIIPPKTLSQTSITEWNDVISKNDVLFTSCSQDYGVDDNFFNKLHCTTYIFPNFNSSGMIEKKAKELHNERQFTKIISTSEVDVLRSAKLRSDLNITGQDINNAILFRDKTIMKRFLGNHDIKIPRYKRIYYATDLINFINEVGYDVVVKPNLGAGSANTIIIKDDDHLNSLLAQGLIDSSYGTPDLIAESFIKGRMYHVDGLVLNNKLIINQPSAYFNSCIEFHTGTHVGSYMLDESNPLTTRLKDLNQKVLAILQGPENFAFHAEYFHDNNDQLIFCEIASRPGGGAVKDAIYARYGINLITECMKSDIQKDYQSPARSLFSNTLTGFLLVPPSSGVLRHVPDEIPFAWVKKYCVTASINSEHKGNARTSGEIVSILIDGNNESELLDRINTVSLWMNENLQWG